MTANATPIARSALMALSLAFFVAACSSGGSGYDPSRSAGKSPHYKVGKPYKINGRWYRPEEDDDYEKVGIASWYGRDFHGKRTANGEIYDMNRLSAAHTTLPMPSMVEVKNLKNGRKIVVRVNDRGPFADDRLIDLSREAARRLGFEKDGLTKVRVKFLGPAQLSAKAPKQSPRMKRAAVEENPNLHIATVGGQEGALAAVQPILLATEPVENSYEIRVVDGTAGTEPNAEQGKTPIQVASLSMDPVDSASDIEAPVDNEAPAEVVSGPTALVSPALVPDADGPPDTHTAQYEIRIAALSQLDNIEVLKARLESIGPLTITPAESATGSVFYRINMGPFTSLEMANERLDAVREAGYDDAGIVDLQR